MLYCVNIIEQSDGSCDVDECHYFLTKEEALQHFTPGTVEINDDNYWTYSYVSEPYLVSDDHYFPSAPIPLGKPKRRTRTK